MDAAAIRTFITGLLRCLNPPPSVSQPITIRFNRHDPSNAGKPPTEASGARCLHKKSDQGRSISRTASRNATHAISKAPSSRFSRLVHRFHRCSPPNDGRRVSTSIMMRRASLSSPEARPPRIARSAVEAQPNRSAPARAAPAPALGPPDFRAPAPAPDGREFIGQDQEAKRNHPETKHRQETETAADYQQDADDDAGEPRARHGELSSEDRKRARLAGMVVVCPAHGPLFCPSRAPGVARRRFATYEATAGRTP